MPTPEELMAMPGFALTANSVDELAHLFRAGAEASRLPPQLVFAALCVVAMNLADDAAGIANLGDGFQRCVDMRIAQLSRNPTMQ